MGSLVYDDIDEQALNSPPRRKARPNKNPEAAGDFAIPSLNLKPTSPQDVMNNLVVRELENPSGEIEAVSGTVDLYGALMKAVSRGEEIGPLRTDIARVTRNQPEKADALLSVLRLIDQERTGDFVVIRAKTEKVIKRAAQRGDLTTGEALTVWSIASKVIADNQRELVKNVKNVEESVLDKVDHHMDKEDRRIAKRWEGSTPQGREIVRKKLYALKQQMTVTVEEEETVSESEEQPPVDI